MAASHDLRRIAACRWHIAGATFMAQTALRLQASAPACAAGPRRVFAIKTASFGLAIGPLVSDRWSSGRKLCVRLPCWRAVLIIAAAVSGSAAPPAEQGPINSAFIFSGLSSVASPVHKAAVRPGRGANLGLPLPCRGISAKTQANALATAARNGFE